MPEWEVDIFVKDTGGTYQKLNEGSGAFREKVRVVVDPRRSFELDFSVKNQQRDLSLQYEFIRDVSFNGDSLEFVSKLFGGHNFSWLRKISGKSAPSQEDCEFKIKFRDKSELMGTDIYKHYAGTEESGGGAAAADVVGGEDAGGGASMGGGRRKSRKKSKRRKSKRKKSKKSRNRTKRRKSSKRRRRR